MKARTLLALALILVGAGAVVLLARHGSTVARAPARAGGAAGDAGAAGPAAYDTTRIVSLAPAITETLFALGKGDALVGVSLYSDYPVEAKRIASVGAGTSPDLEAIARLSPTLILGEETKILPVEKVAPLGRTRLLPWLTPAEIVRSVRELGAIVDRRAQAEEIASRMEQRFRAAPAASSPRVLMLFGDAPGRIGPMYFAKAGSLHDELLVAGGGRNAIEGEVQGAPTLSVEGLLRLDPDAILLLVADDELPAERRAQYLADFEALSTLRAVRERHVRVLHGSVLYVTGPRVLAVIDQVAAALRDMGYGEAAAAELPARP